MKECKISLTSVWLTYRSWLYIFRHFTQNNFEKQSAAPSCFFWSAPDCSWNFIPVGFLKNLDVFLTVHHELTKTPTNNLPPTASSYSSCVPTGHQEL